MRTVADSYAPTQAYISLALPLCSPPVFWPLPRPWDCICLSCPHPPAALCLGRNSSRSQKIASARGSTSRTEASQSRGRIERRTFSLAQAAAAGAGLPITCRLSVLKTAPPHCFVGAPQMYSASHLRRVIWQRPPSPWQVPATVQTLFRTSEQQIEVPRTSFVKTCHHCAGHKKIRCHQCAGRGKLRCMECRGQGHEVRKDKDGNRYRETCKRCYGSGRKRCSECHGHGQVSCPVCLAAGKLRTYIRLTVRWCNHSDDHIVESLNMPGGVSCPATGRHACRARRSDPLP